MSAYGSESGNRASRRAPSQPPVGSGRIGAALMGACLLCMAAGRVEAGPTRRVLIMNSYHKEFRWTDVQVSGAREVLTEAFEDIEFYVEYMDTKRLYSQEYLELLARTFRLKYKSVKLDAIIATDDNALQMVMKLHGDVFTGVPVSFCGINDYDPSLLAGRDKFTGLVEVLDIKPTIDLALKLHPATRRVVVIVDDTPTGMGQRKDVALAAEQYKDLQFEYLKGEDLTNAELLARLRELPSDSIVLLTVWLRDKTGTYFPTEVEGPLISLNSAVPVYAITDMYLGHGIVGGKVLNSRTHGRTAAEMMVRILKGRRPSDIPVVIESVNPYMFDARQLDRWGISESDLPEGSIIVNRPFSFYEEYKSLIWEVAAALAVLLLAVLVLSWNIMRRRRAEHALRRRAVETASLLSASRAVLECRTFEEAARAIFEACKNATGATSGYVALLSGDGARNEVLFHDIGGGLREGDPDTSMPIRGPWSETCRTGQIVCENDFADSEWMRSMPSGHMRLENVMFAPLMIEGRAAGLLGLANKPGGFTEDDKRMAAAFGELAAIALRNSRAEEQVASLAKFPSENPNPVLRVAPGGEVLYANAAAKALPLGHEGQTGLSAPEQWLAILTRALNSGQQEKFEEPLGDRTMSFVVAPVGEGNYVNVYGRDITERKRAEADRRTLEGQIQHAQKLESLGVLAGGIAHDFNNLLMAILGNADLAMMDLSPASPVRQNVAAIKNASLRAADLARQMLAYSGKGRFVIGALDLSQVVEEMAHMLEVSVSKKAVLKYDFGDSLPPIEADATQIRQVIMNLITNASEAIGDKSGVISITTGAIRVDRRYLQETYLDEDLSEGLYVTLEVADTGCGMDAETQAKLFDPFFTTKFTGRGLGMAAVLGIVRGHEGTIKVYSEVGRGTTMKVLFPAATADLGAAPGEARSDPEWHGSGTVLLVDDEESVRAIAQTMLERMGLTVVIACDGRQAIDIYSRRADEIDCVLMDLTMPHMDGEQAFHELRRIDPDVRVLMSSGYNEQEVVQRFLGKGIAGFIQKPYEVDKLAGTMRRVLGD